MIFGIDLGTTNSLICYLKDGVPTAIPNANGDLLTPSVVSIDETDTVLVGAIARERLYKYSSTTVASFKRLIGTTQVTKLGKKSFKPEELSALVLRALKADAEALLGEAVNEVIISVPAYFNDAQRKATKVAGELAGLSVKRLINEPTAAALFHGIQDRDIEAKFLIFDLGGGTFDVSILEKFDGVMEVRATGGDSFLGGDDFTKVLVDLFAQKIKLTDKQLEDSALMATVRFVADNAKRTLSEQESTLLELKLADEIKTATITQDEFELACKPLLERLRAPIERALRDARLRSADLDEIVMVGGATRMPLVRKLVAQLFGRLPARYIDPDQTIGLGAAVCAGLIARDANFDEIVLTDVCPHSLGVAVSEEDGSGGWFTDVFLPIIERNTVVPASRVRSLYTVSDNQKKLAVDIYQGESRRCSNNVLLGKIEVPVPPQLAGEVSVSVRYTYDVNGILDVDVEVEKTGLSKNLVIKKLAGDISDEEISRRRIELAALKVHPRDQEENRVVMERGNRLYEQFLGGEREQVGRLIDQFNKALETQELKVIAEARKAFANALNSVERGDVW
ncbi:MAG: molecular chaperone HscC [Methylophilaceae bacterium]